MKLITPTVALIIASLLVGVPFIAWYNAETPEPLAVGGFGDPFLSIQLATSTLTNGFVLQTNGTNSTWVSTSSLGISGSGGGATTLDGLNDVTITSSSSGDILYLGGSGQWVNLAKGSDGQVLKLASGLPSWGTDNTSAGGSGLGTTTPWTAGQLAVVATDGAVKSIGTSTLSETVTGLEFDANPWIVGSARTLSLTSGYTIPLSASTTEWATAYASTTALTPSYIRGLFSNSATGLTYNSSTGATSLTSGYVIPLTASTTEWATAYGWGNHASAGYLTSSVASSTYLRQANNLGDLANVATARTNLGLGTIALLNSIDISDNTNLSVTATGLSLSGDAIALSAGYSIPLTASTTEWHNFRTTPSDRITAGTNLSWSGNTLNVNGSVSFTNASTTNLTVSGNTYLGVTSAIPVAGANGLLSAYAGVTCTNQVLRVLSASGAGTCTTINNAYWSGTDLSVANGGTGASTLTGVLIGNGTSAVTGTTTLTASYIQDVFLRNDGDVGTGNYDFSGASSFRLPYSSNLSLSSDGQLYIDSSGRFGQIKLDMGTSTAAISPNFDRSWSISSSSPDRMSRMLSSGTTTWPVWNPTEPVTLNNLYCITEPAGTARARVGDGTNWTSAAFAAASSTNPAELVTSSNNTFTARETIYIQIGSGASSPDWVTCTLNFSYTEQ